MSYFPQTAITDTSGNAIVVGQTTKSASLPVTIASDQTVLSQNLTQVNGTAITLGQKTASASIPVTLASDNGISQAAASPDTTSAPSATIVIAGKTNDSTPKYSILPLGANGKSVVTQPMVTNLVSGTATTTATTDTSVIAAQGAGIKIYMTGFSVYNSGATAAVITFKNGSGGSTMWTTFVPAGGVSNLDIPSPIATSANTALYFAASASSTTIGVAVCGFSGT